jgi:hypothetical protein
MEFLDEMPADEKEEKVIVKKPKKKTIQTKLPTEGFGLEIGSLTFSSDDADLELRDVKIRDMDEFRNLLLEVLG